MCVPMIIEKPFYSNSLRLIGRTKVDASLAFVAVAYLYEIVCDALGSNNCYPY